MAKRKTRRKTKRYDSSQIEPELGMSLDELNRILNDPSKWIPHDPKLFDKWLKDADEEE